MVPQKQFGDSLTKELTPEVQKLLEELSVENIEAVSSWHSGARAERQYMRFERQRQAIESADMDTLKNVNAVQALLRIIDAGSSWWFRVKKKVISSGYEDEGWIDSHNDVVYARKTVRKALQNIGFPVRIIDEIEHISGSKPGVSLEGKHKRIKQALANIAIEYCDTKPSGGE